MNIGFIGCGHIAHFHADVLFELGVNIAAASARENSPNIGPFVEKYNINKYYTNWEKMIENETLDALWVVTSWNQINSLLIPLIKTGIPLFLEKPVALSSEKIREAIDLHVGTKQYIQVGYNRRFYPFIDEIKSIIENGELRSVLVEIPESVDLTNIEFSTNLWLTNSSHVIDLLMFFVGPLDIKYKTQKILPNTKIPSSFNAILGTGQDIPIHLIAEWNTANNFGLTFIVNNKRIVLKPLENARIYEGFEVVEPSNENPVRQYKPNLIKEYKCGGNYKPGFFKQAEYFIDKYSSGLLIDSQKASTLHTSLEATMLIEEIIN